ncbi:MAG TPA: GUN4 domain-containing protein [Leptolyngbyaceae cyanobacterium]
MKRSLCALLLVGTALVSANFTPVMAFQVSSTAQVPAPALAQAAAPRVDISKLQAALEAQDWQTADAETRRLLETWIHPNGDIFSPPLATNVPPEVLQTVDKLWTEASGGRFGLSAQKAIWEEARAAHPDNTDTASKAFGDRVGWTRPTRDPDNFVSPDWLTEPELNYSLEAPVGHLPWAGISWERINGMLTAQSCGSCMVDAMYLQDGRFNQYLPNLFNWLSTALVAELPAEGTWRQARLAHTINLRSLYPNSTCPAYPIAQAVSPDSKVLAISSYSYERACTGATDNSALALWNAERGTRIITLLRGQATESATYTGQAQEPPTQSTRIVGDVANAVAFTPDGRWVVAGLSDGTLRVWTTDRGEAVRTISAHFYAVRAIAISADGQTLASASSDQTIRLWNLQTGKLIRTITLNASSGIPQTVLFSPDGQRLATTTNRNTLQLWNVQTGQLVRTLVEQAPDLSPGLSLAFSPDSQKLAAADVDNSVKLWNATTGARLITLKGHSSAIHDLAFSPDGQYLASSEETKALLWNLQTYQPTHTFELVQSAGHPIKPDNLANVAFSPDSKTLATGGLLLPLVQSEPIPSQGIMLWDVATGQTLEHIHSVSRFQFSPDGQFLVANGQGIQIWQPYNRLISRSSTGQ